MRFDRKLAVITLLVGALAARADVASAQQPSGFALDHFDPADRGSEWFAADSLDLRGHLRPAAGIVGSWAYKPLVVYNADGSERGAIVRNEFVTHLGGSLVLWNRVRGGLDVPLALYQSGDVPTAPGIRTASPKPAFGDVRVSADVRLLGTYGGPFEGALGAALYLPTGLRDQYTSDGNVRFAPRASVAGDIDIFTYAGRLAFDYRALTARFGDGKPLGSTFDLTAAAGVRLVDKKLVVGPELFASTVTNAGSFFAKTTTPVEGLLGAHYTMMKDFRVGAGVGTGLTRGWGSPVFRGLLSAEWAPAFDDDTDHDGVPNSTDACPTVPGVRTADPKTNGCPPPPPPPPSDRDNDGIIDDVDACPDVAGVRTDDPKTNGCPPAPPPPPPDRDADGIPDADDACPDVPGVKSDDPKKNGCPPDRDGDSIIDANDACPDVPGPADPDPKKNGCPLARIENGQVVITQQVKFKTSSAEILHESDPILTAVADILRDHPEVAKIRVEGHTDNRGAAAYNKDLSKKRAASVVLWLIRAGVPKDRLTSQGFGLEHPIDTNDTEEGRQNNRRVEFHVVEAPPKK